MELNFQISGFKDVPQAQNVTNGCVQLLKRQTLNYNRAVCVIVLDQMPDDFEEFLKSVRKKVAFKIGFVPLFWALGLQVIVACPDILKSENSPRKYVAKVNNQWAIIQSIFLIDPEVGGFIEARSWGQTITGKYQNSISNQLKTIYEWQDNS